MLNPNDPEDRLIRWILISLGSAAVLGFVATATVVSILVSMNFNIMEWME
ncbi:MAG: hypothetical protein SFU53_04455 [Terrimicrobiaceae bacterium]|nr:hypothetical protein [Terrimicrobiaceae bacterium]